MGTESEDDFDDLFSDMDLTSNKLGRTEEAKNTLIANPPFSAHWSANPLLLNDDRYSQYGHVQF